MICPFCERDIPDDMVAKHFASIGGRSTSKKKAAAAKLNASKPAGKGKKRGRPRKAVLVRASKPTERKP